MQRHSFDRVERVGLCDSQAISRKIHMQIKFDINIQADGRNLRKKYCRNIQLKWEAF